jgi:hypothetical protein
VRVRSCSLVYYAVKPVPEKTIDRRSQRCPALTTRGIACKNKRQNNAELESSQAAPTTTTESPLRLQRVVISLTRCTRRTPGKVNQKSTENAGPSNILPGVPDQTGQSSIEEAASRNSIENAGPLGTSPSDPDKTNLSSIEETDTLGELPCTPVKLNENPVGNEGIKSMLVSGSRGSSAGDIAKMRQGFMASNLHRRRCSRH